ncbi:hypothetical protein IKG29_01955 [Candidatus Saccharibacteria bacterium]|nr:hypothetical protein [Candidatus Saccharibacteria bacterium]
MVFARNLTINEKECANLKFSFEYILYHSVNVEYGIPGGSVKFYDASSCCCVPDYTKVYYETQRKIPIYLATSLSDATKVDDILGEELGLRYLSCSLLNDEDQNVSPAKAGKVVVYFDDKPSNNLIKLPEFG